MKYALMTVAAFLVAIWFVFDSVTAEASEHNMAYPHMIVCEVKGIRLFAYLDRIEADGRAFYLTPSGKGGSVTKDGVITRPGAIKGSCSGKTLKELIANGQAHFMQK